jgi:hypothetical protein
MGAAKRDARRRQFRYRLWIDTQQHVAIERDVRHRAREDAEGVEA